MSPGSPAAAPPASKGSGDPAPADPRRPLKPFLVAAACLAVLAASVPVTLAVRRVTGDEAVVAIGKGRAPDFSLTSLDGVSIDLASLRGKPVVVNFWASWCVPCREEFPVLVDAAERHVDDGVQFVGVIFHDLPSDARSFAKDHDASWPMLEDPGGATARAFGVRGPPHTFFIDTRGQVVSHVSGRLSRRVIDRQIERAVGADS